MTTRNVLQLDRDSTAPFQEEMYKGSKENPEVGSHFSYELSQRAHAPKNKFKMDMTPGGDGEYIYTASKKYDILFDVKAYVDLIPIKVKDKYAKSVSICYPHNLGHNILYLGELKIDDDHKQTIDTIYMDIYSQFLVTKRKSYDRMVGNLPCLEKWGTELPGIPLAIPQPFFLCRKTQLALPIWKCSNKITFEYKIKTKLVDLLRMRIRKSNGEYKIIKCNMKYLECKTDAIPVPELYARYSELTDEERNWRITINPKTKEQEKLIIYIEDINMTSSANLTPIGSKVQIPLKSIFPAKSIFWVAQLENGSPSNYTTNRDDVYEGFNPCAKSCIKYGGNDRVIELTNTHFDVDEPYDFFPGEPCDAGYNCFTFEYHPELIQFADNAVVLQKCGAVLEVTLGDTNPFCRPEEEEEEIRDENGELVPKEALDEDDYKIKRDKYIVHVRTVVMRKMEVYWSDKDSCLKYDFIN